MVRTETPVCDFDQAAATFNLKGVDDNQHSLESLRGENGLLVMFICNHCPYVKSIIHRIIRKFFPKFSCYSCFYPINTMKMKL